MKLLPTEGHMSKPRERSPSRGPRCLAPVSAAILLLLQGLAACGSRPVTQPSADLTGVWNYSYRTRAAQACGPPAPPGLTPGCAGAAEATLTQAGGQIDGAMVLRGYCESCGSVAD